MNLDGIKNNPAVIIGVIAAAILAGVQAAAGQGLIGADAAATIGRALDPAQGGWALPILAGIVTRFFTYGPKTVEKVAAQAAATGNPAVTLDPP